MTKSENLKTQSKGGYAGLTSDRKKYNSRTKTSKSQGSAIVTSVGVLAAGIASITLYNALKNQLPSQDPEYLENNSESSLAELGRVATSLSKIAFGSNMIEAATSYLFRIK